MISFSKVPKSLQDTSKLMTGNAATKVIGIIVLAFYARVLSRDDMAIFPIYMMLGGLSSLIFSFGIMPNMIKQLPILLKKDAAEAHRLILTSSTIYIFGTIFVSAIVFFYSSDINNLLLKGEIHPALIQIMSVGFVSLSIGQVAEQVLWASGRFGSKSILAVTESMVRPVCTVSLFLLFGVKGLVIGLVLAQSLKAAIAVFFSRDIIFGGFFGFFSPSKLLRQSLPFYLEGYLMYFRREGDSWLVSTMLGTGQLAVYYIAKTVHATLAMFFNSIDQVSTQRLAKKKDNKSALFAMAKQLFDNLFQTMIPALFLVITLLPAAIPLVGGGKYSEAIVPAILLMLALLVEFIRIPLSRTLFVTLPAVNRVVMTMIESIGLLVALLIFTPLLGIAGVALSRGIGQLVGLLASAWILKRKNNIYFPFQKVIPVLLASCIPSFLILFLFQPSTNIVDILQYLLLSPLLWIGIFLVFTWLVNRQLFEIIQTLVQSVLRTTGER